MNTMNTMNIEPFGNWWAREERRRRVQKRKDTVQAILFGLVFSGSLTLASVLEAVL